jgi:hypothetical protein
MFDSSNGNLLDSYTPEQKAYIQKYAAGLLISWTADHARNFISPDIGDGFEPPEGVFPVEDVEWQAHSDVIQVLEKWLDKVQEYVGFQPGDEIPLSGGKYPTLPPHDHT